MKNQSNQKVRDYAGIGAIIFTFFLIAIVTALTIYTAYQIAYGLSFEDIKKAGQLTKERLRQVEDIGRPYQHEPEVLNAKDMYNQTYYDYYNYWHFLFQDI